MVPAVAQQAAGIGLGSQKTAAKIGISNLAKRRKQQSAAGGRAGAKTKAMLAGVVAVALVAVMCNDLGEFWVGSATKVVLHGRAFKIAQPTICAATCVFWGVSDPPQILPEEQRSSTRYKAPVPVALSTGLL